MRVSEVMTPEPLAAAPRTSVSEAIDMLEVMEVRHLPVVNDRGSVVGILSDRDFRGLSRVDREGSERLEARLKEPVEALMNPVPYTLPEDASVSEAIQVILDNRVGAIPITAPHERRLVGIVSYVDLLRYIHSSVDGF